MEAKSSPETSQSDLKVHHRWYSDRLEQEVSVVRWGASGTPVLMFPTAGGDAEEIERFLMIDALAPLLEACRIKVYSCDSVAGRVLLGGEGSEKYRAWMQNQFHDFIYREVVPAIRADCGDPDIGIISTGTSIGAFNAVAVLCRYPDVFHKAIALSGTYDLVRFLDLEPSHDFYVSSPLHFLPHLDENHLKLLRRRFVLLASGEGRWEDIGESFRLAHLLGSTGIPNRVDSWGSEWDHDWVTWRKMLPRYLDEMA